MALKTVLTLWLLCSTNRSMTANGTNSDRPPTWRTRRRQRQLVAANRLLQIGVPAAGLLTLLAGFFWIADLLANLRMQLVVAGVVGSAVALFLKQWKTVAAHVLMLSIHASWVVLPPPRAEVTAGLADITVTALNAYIDNDQHELIAVCLRDLSADVIAVTELSPDLCEYLTVTFADSHPYVAAKPHAGTFGAGIFSKYPLLDIDIIGAETTGRSLLATVRKHDQNYRVAAVHPYSPMTPGHFELRNQHLDALSRAIQTGHERQPETPFIVTGDFNSTPWSPRFSAFQRASGLRHVAEGSGVVPTWYAFGLPVFPVGLVLDHCMVSPQLSYVSYGIGPSVDSDHLPLTVGLSLKP